MSSARRPAQRNINRGTGTHTRRRQGRGHRAASPPVLGAQVSEERGARRAASTPATPLHPERPSDRGQWRIPLADSLQPLRPDPASRTTSQPRELWLGCHFVDLPVDAILSDPTHAGFINPAAPMIVHDGHPRQPVLVACNTAARAHGLQPGMGLGVAHTLVAGIQACLRDPGLESTLLERLAIQAMRFSSRVVIEAPDVLLLEIGASLRLFHSLESLLEHFADCFGTRTSATSIHSTEASTHDANTRFTIAVAPTSSAAELLCTCSTQAANGYHIVSVEQLHSTLAAVPIADLPLTERACKTLNGMGITRLGDLRRLPRDGIARRVGPDVVEMLDRLTGQKPQPRRYFMPADYFRSSIVLSDDIISLEQLLVIADRLIDELEVHLMARASGVHQLKWRFDHHDGTATRLQLNISKLGQCAKRFKDLMRTRTENMLLTGPVHTVTLRSSRLERITMQAASLFPELEGNTVSFDLIDRLRARLGEDSVNAVEKMGEHTPEKSWRLTNPTDAAISSKRARTQKSNQENNQKKEPHSLLTPRRPVWLMRSPRRLACVEEKPWLNGPLELLDGPERVETAWWESNTRRDYYVALSQKGRLLWVFHDLKTKAWYVQGAFI